MTLSVTTTTGTIAPNNSQDFEVPVGSTLTVTFPPNSQATVTENPLFVGQTTTAGKLDQRITRVDGIPQTVTCGPYPTGANVTVAVSVRSSATASWSQDHVGVVTATRDPATGTTTLQAGGGAVVSGHLFDTGSLAKDRAEDKQREFYECLRFPALHFDPTASDDSGDGSRGRPYRDLTAARLTPGRRHLIKAGTTITPASGTPWLAIPSTGTEAAPIIIGRYGDSHLANPIIDGSACNRVIRGNTNAKHWRVRDLEIIGPKSGSDRYIISQNSLSASTDAQINFGIVLARLKLRDVTTDGATDCNGVKLYGGDNTILDCEVFDIADDAIWFHGYRTKISGCSIYRVGQSGRTAGDCIQCGAKSDGSVIRGNWLDHFERDYKQCIYFEQTVSISDSVLIEDNYCVSADGNAGAAGPIVCGATNSIVRRNFCKGGYVGIGLGAGSKALNNVVVMTVGRGIDLGANAEAHHNTIIQTGTDTSQTWSVGIRAQSGDVNGRAYNNVLIGMYNGILSSMGAGEAPIDERNNAFAIRGVSDAKVRVNGAVVPANNPISGTYASWGATLGLDLNMRPVDGSPLIGAAFPVSGLDGLDKDQKNKPPAIGAYY